MFKVGFLRECIENKRQNNKKRYKYKPSLDKKVFQQGAQKYDLL